MPIFINKGEILLLISEIWPCYSLARNLFKHTYFLLIASLLFTPFPYSKSVPASGGFLLLCVPVHRSRCEYVFNG